MSRRTSILVLAIVGVFAMGLTQVAVSFPHKHKIQVRQFFQEIVVPPGQVGGGVVFCPGGYTATGGGTDYVDGLGVIASSGFGERTDQFLALIDNFDSAVQAVNFVQVACVKSTKSANARQLSRAQSRAALETDIDALQAAHEEAASARSPSAG